jgi:GLPGLI family protein
MKTTLLIITAISLGLQQNAISQEANELTSGKITYSEKVKLEIKVNGDDSQLTNMLPSERKSEKVLLFTKDQTLFQDGVTPEENINQENGTGVIVKFNGSGQNKLYTDLKKKSILDQHEFLNRIFLVEKPLTSQDWKISGNQKTILGYPCMEAVKTDSAGIKTVVWFSPSIPVGSGPAGLCDLPGIILEADINNGSRTYITTSIEKLAPSELNIRKPKEGKRVTSEEYRKIVAEKMKEMGIENGSGGEGASHVTITIRK